MSFLAIGIPILPALPAVLSISALTIAMMILGLRKRGSGEPSCGHCGYGVRGLPTFTCPECGSDLRQVGIVSSGGSGNPIALLFRALASAWKRLVLATLAILALAAIAMYLALTFVFNYDVFPNSEVVLEPASKDYRAILNQVGAMRHAPGTFGAKSDRVFGHILVIQLTGPYEAPDHNTDFRIDLDTWSSYLYHWTAGVAPTLPPTRFNRGELEKFFKEKNIDTAGQTASAEIDSLLLLIDACRSAPLAKVAPSAAKFTVVSAADKRDIQLNTGGIEPGVFFLSVAISVWTLAISGMVIARMFKLAGRAALTAAGREALIAPAPPIATGNQVAKTLTILFSDIKDFTAHSAATSRTGAIELARRHRELSLPIPQKRRGNLVKTIGDALLVTFDSATDAILAGLDIQSAAQACVTPLHLRIAVTTGEVIVEAGDVYGETVNLASRLQSIAKPGEVVLSAPTRALINSREVQAESFGEHQLAGFQSPIQVFVARPIAATTTH